MNRITAILFSILFPLAFVNGQKTIRGTVTSGAGSKPLAGVLVTPKDKKLPAALTGSDGRYMIKVDENAVALTVKKKGFKSSEVLINRSFIDIFLEADPAFNPTSENDTYVKSSRHGGLLSDYVPDSVKDIEAERGYGLFQNLISSSSMKLVRNGSDLNPAYAVNINNILAGKYPGLKLYSQAGMALGRTGSVSLRGPTGFSTGEGPSYYLDGILISNTNDIPYFDIKEVTVISGPSSSALLGSFARNGAVLINTGGVKSRATGAGIIINSGIQISTVNLLPAYQDSYAGGAYSDLQKYTWLPGHPEAWKPLDGKYYHDYSDDSSWGPAMAGQEYIPWYAWYEGTPYTGKTALLNPQPNNVRDFFETGRRLSNTVTLYKKSENLYISSTVGAVNTSGNIPYTSINKYYFTFTSSYSVSEKLTLDSDMSFFTTMQKGETDDNYSNQTTGAFNSWYHRDIETEKLREFEDYRVPGTGIISTWNHGNPVIYDPAWSTNFYANFYWLNPYTYLKAKSVNERTDNLRGKINLNYIINDFLSAEVGFRGEAKTFWNEEKVPQYSFSGLQALGDFNNYYLTGTGSNSQGSLTAILKGAKRISNISVAVEAGLDLFQNTIKKNGARTTSGLIIPNLYTIANSRDLPRITDERSMLKTRSLFLHSALGYRDLLFFDFLVRPEWHSTLPAENNMIVAKSIGGAFVFSRLFSLPFIDHGKIRTSWGVIPSGLIPYQYPGFAYGVSQYQWKGSYLSSTPEMLIREDVKGPVKKETEIGLDLVLLRNLVSIGLTYWSGREEGIPVNTDLPGYTGFSRELAGSGVIERGGYDLILTINPFRNEKLQWKSALIFSKLEKNTVVSTGNGAGSILVQSLWSANTPSMMLIPGQPWGVITGSGMVTKNGIPLLNSGGTYISKAGENFGSVYPSVTGGLQNELSIGKNIRLNINLDYQAGGRFFSLSQMWGTYSGLTARTASVNDKGISVRLPVTDGGGVHVSGIDVNMLKEVDYYVEAQEYFHSLYNNRIFNSFVFDASYVKLRELSLSYKIRFDEGKTGSFLKGAEITVYSENLFMIWAAQKNFDPSELQFTCGEKGQFPSVRSFGTNLRFEF